MSSPRSSFGWAVGLLVAASAVGIILGNALSKGSGVRSIDPPIVRTSDEYNLYLKRAEKLSADVLDQFDRGTTPDDKQKEDLREAANIMLGLRGFDAGQFRPHYLEGKIRYALDEYQKSLDLMQQCITLAPPPTTAPPPEVIALIADAHYVSSRCLLVLGRYQEAAVAADLASKMVPRSANYWVALASAEMQLNEDKKAMRHLDQALFLDAEHPEAQRLKAFLGKDRPEQPPKKGTPPKVK